MFSDIGENKCIHNVIAEHEGKHSSTKHKSHSAESNRHKKSKSERDDSRGDVATSVQSLVKQWRSSGLKAVSRHKSFLLRGPKFSFVWYRKFWRKFKPFLHSNSKSSEIGLNKKKYWLSKVTGEELYVSAVVSLAVLGGLIGYGIGEFLAS